MLAVSDNDPETPAVVKLLRDRGADPYRAADDGYSPIEIARMIDPGPIRDAFADLL